MSCPPASPPPASWSEVQERLYRDALADLAALRARAERAEEALRSLPFAWRWFRIWQTAMRWSHLVRAPIPRARYRIALDRLGALVDPPRTVAAQLAAPKREPELTPAGRLPRDADESEAVKVFWDGAWCNAVPPNEPRPYCTRHPGHHGDHVAAGTGVIYGRWPAAPRCHCGAKPMADDAAFTAGPGEEYHSRGGCSRTTAVQPEPGPPVATETDRQRLLKSEPSNPASVAEKEGR